MTEQHHEREWVDQNKLGQLSEWGIIGIDSFLWGESTSSELSDWAKETLDANLFRSSDVKHIMVSNSIRRLTDLDMPQNQLIERVKDVRSRLNGDKRINIAFLGLHGH